MERIEGVWERFLREGGRPDAESFGVWLIRHAGELDRKVDGDKPVQPFGDTAQSAETVTPMGYAGLDMSVRAGILIGRLRRFLHLRTKPALREARLSEDEFTVLATLLYMPGTTKTQLLKQCLIELPTGSELLKRMKLSGLVLEKQNPEDGRSALISMSAKGRQHLVHAFRLLGGVEDMLSALSAEEKQHLLFLLGRLDQHHSGQQDILQMQELMGRHVLYQYTSP